MLQSVFMRQIFGPSSVLVLLKLSASTVDHQPAEVPIILGS